MTFNKDLQFGNKYEKEFLNHINYDSFKYQKVILNLMIYL